MTGAREFADGTNQPPDSYPEGLNGGDIAGELCDKWVREGYAFVQYADGGYEKAQAEPRRPFAEAAIEYNPGLVSEVMDGQGRAMKIVNATGFSAFTGKMSPMGWLLSHMPPEHLLCAEPLSENWEYPHPSGAIPIGIKLGSLPAVMEIVAGARTQPFRETTDNSDETLILWPPHRRKLLAFFDAVMTPPPVSEPEPVSELKHRAPAEDSSKAAQPAAPPQKPEVPRPAPRVQALPKPKSAAPRAEPQSDEKWQAVLKILSHVAAAEFGLSVGITFGAISRGTVATTEIKVMVATAALSGMVMVATYFSSKEG